MKKQEGITLVALVVTIVIIVILASVTISATFGENGIIKKAELARDLASNSIAKENEDMNSLMDEYTNIMTGGGEVPEPPKDETPPTVDIVVGETTDTSIAITANATDDSGEVASYKYYLNGVEKNTLPTNTYTFTGLTAKTEYTIKVEAFDKANNKGEKEIKASTKKKDTIADIIGGDKVEDNTEVEDDSGNKVWIPGGFGVAPDSGTKVDDGIVIEDKKGSQFVWIPVNDESLEKMYNTTGGEKQLNGVTTKTSVYSNLRKRTGDNYTVTVPGKATGIREPDVLSKYDTNSSYTNILGHANAQAMADAMVKEYNATYESIKKYDGFYIGRYEITGSVDTPTVQKGGTVITDQNWYNLKKACSNVVSSKYAQSTMIYGNQWDEVMSWLIATGEKNDSEVNSDSSSWGNCKNSSGNATTGSGEKRTAGYSEYWKSNNIYDLAGNCYEWTQEANGTDIRVVRGGGYNNSGSVFPASDRGGDVSSDGSASVYSSRPALYVALNAK